MKATHFLASGKREKIDLMRPQRILIIGGAGFICANLANHYLALGCKVAIVDNFCRKGSEDNVKWLSRRHGEQLEVMCADIRTEGVWQDEGTRADVVFHPAAQVAVSACVADPRTDFEVNVRGALSVLEAARTARQKPVLLHSSTNKVYGNLENTQVVERDSRYLLKTFLTASPKRTYLISGRHAAGRRGRGSVCSRLRAQLRPEDDRLPPVLHLRPRQFGLEDQGWLAWFALRARAGLPITIFGDGKQFRDGLYIDDFVAAFEAAVQRVRMATGHACNIRGGPSEHALVVRTDRTA